MIQNIRVNLISPHPDNPRKDLGDLTELAASIKSQGILQNLTVVSMFDTNKMHAGYRVVIGHRRLAAAKLAGLTEVPCVISDMDHKTQVATMLLENLQRTDLTIWEQANGFQMMLDFGDTVEEVAARTGFSESTIRRRVKLLELDPAKFKKSVERGATLQDYAELDRIRDIKLKNKVLEKIGTSDFQWELRQAIETEQKDKNRAAMIAELEQFATRVETTEGLRSVTWLSVGITATKVERPADAGEKKYYFMVNGMHYIQLLEEATQQPQQQPQGPTYTGPSPADETAVRRRRQLDELAKRAACLRDNFVRNFAGSKKHAVAIMELAVWALWQMMFDSCDDEDFLKMLNIETTNAEEEDEDDGQVIFAAIAEAFERSPEWVLLAAAWCSILSGKNYHNWYGEHQKNAELDKLYDILEKLGYELSAEERALRDGTHELYASAETRGVD